MRQVADPVEALVREADFGRYAATLFAPAEARPHLLALYAFDIEISRVRDLVSDPMPGELRLQWWRDALENPERADVVSHPVARALHAAAAYGRLPADALVALVDAHIDDLYDDPVPTLGDLEGRLGATHSAPLRLACLILAAGREPGGADAAGLGGVARGLAEMLRLLPKHAARGQILLPAELMSANGVSRDDVAAGRSSPGLVCLVADLARHGLKRLGEARAAFADLSPEARPALLPLALTDPALRRLARPGADPMRPRPPDARWAGLVRLWIASRRTPPF